MKYIISCGGRGERFIGSYPKPLNKACGKMIGEWMIQSFLENTKDIKNKHLIWVLNPKLYDYNIEKEIIRWINIIDDPTLCNTFIKLPFQTRDISEALEIVLSNLDFNEDFICLDNDNIYIDGLDTFHNLDKSNINAAILVSMMKPGKEYPPRYGFLKVVNGIIIDGKEKVIGWGENALSYGGYWFSSRKTCQDWLECQKLYDTTPIGERSLLSLIIKYSKMTYAIITNNSFSIGTPEDCEEAQLLHNKYFGWNGIKLSLNCNTINDSNVLNWIIDKTNKGAELITNSNSHSDIYINNHGINPYDKNWILSAGDWTTSNSNNLINALPTTRNVVIDLKHVDHITKTGSNDELRGQAYYYNFLNTTSEGRSVNHLFPRCYDIINNFIENKIILDIEYIKGVPASYLWSYNTWGEREWNQCISSLELLHSLPVHNNLSWDNLMDGYISKVESRRSFFPIYTLLDSDSLIWNKIKQSLESYIKTPGNITCIHGDSFMGNIIFSMKGNIKYIDMRGEVNNTLTVCGDPNYDWAKLCTSFLGMDSIVYNLPLRSIDDGIKWINRLPNSKTLIILALCLMYGSLPFYTPNISQSILTRITDIFSYLQ